MPAGTISRIILRIEAVVAALSLRACASACVPYAETPLSSASTPFSMKLRHLALPALRRIAGIFVFPIVKKPARSRMASHILKKPFRQAETSMHTTALPALLSCGANASGRGFAKGAVA